MELERSGIRALLFRERTLRPPHSEVIISLLKSAIEQYATFRSPRSQSHLSVQMAEEMIAAGTYSEALDLLRPIISRYRSEGWDALLEAVLKLGLKCAHLTASVEDYMAFGLELAAVTKAKSLASLSREEELEKRRIITNLCRLLEEKPQIPAAEPGKRL